MSNERDYVSLMPAEPPEGLLHFLQEKEGKLRQGVLAFCPIGREEAEAEMDCEDFAGDFRPEWEREKGRRTALLWCSECGGQMLAEYIMDEGCGRYGRPPAGIRLEDDYIQSSGEFPEESEMKCPHCGAEVRLLRKGALTYGYGVQTFAAALTVSDGLPVVTQWRVEQRTWWKRRKMSFDPIMAYVVDEKQIVKLILYRRWICGDLTCLGEWQQLKKSTDTLGKPLFYDEFPCLDGTSLENAKLPEYYAQAYKDAAFCPLGYIRLYQRHPNIENLVTAGMGKMLGQAIWKDATSRFGYGYERLNIPKLRWIRWKENRPAQMLGLTREQLRQARANGWGVEELEFWNKAERWMSFADAAETLRLAGADAACRMLENGDAPLKTARYLNRQKAAYDTLLDYRRMARTAGLALEEEIVFWPPHLREAHDRVMVEVRYKTSDAEREAFARMSERCTGLCWERDGICIRPAAAPEELIEEGRVLHHCVGGYAKNHAAGNIILFVRHARRPERSWFTLNVNVNEKRVIQLHGYGNERSPEGKRLTIPREVKDFVEQWKEQVLMPWKLPAEKPVKKKAKAEKKTRPAA